MQQKDSYETQTEMVSYHVQEVLPQISVDIWDTLCIQYHEITASFEADLQGRTPLEAMTGETPEISQYLYSAFYELVRFKEYTGIGETKIGIFSGSPITLNLSWVIVFFQQAEYRHPEQPYNESKIWNQNQNNVRNVLRCTTQPLQID